MTISSVNSSQKSQTQSTRYTTQYSEDDEPLTKETSHNKIKKTNSNIISETMELMKQAKSNSREVSPQKKTKPRSKFSYFLILSRCLLILN
jgi:hypothetical protein